VQCAHPERGFSEITNATDFKGWVVGFYGEQSKALAARGVASMIADAAQTAKWHWQGTGRYGLRRDPTDQQRAWLVNKVRTDIAMRETNLKLRLGVNFRAGPAASDEPPDHWHVREGDGDLGPATRTAATSSRQRVPGLGAGAPAGARTAHWHGERSWAQP
jgi:hypothetical protein